MSEPFYWRDTMGQWHRRDRDGWNQPMSPTAQRWLDNEAPVVTGLPPGVAEAAKRPPSGLGPAAIYVVGEEVAGEAIFDPSEAEPVDPSGSWPPGWTDVGATTQGQPKRRVPFSRLIPLLTAAFLVAVGVTVFVVLKAHG